MGHVYGLNHSRVDGSDVDYQDPWDIMSAADVYSAPDPGDEFTLIGPGLNAANMRSPAGWTRRASGREARTASTRRSSCDRSSGAISQDGWLRRPPAVT